MEVTGELKIVFDTVEVSEKFKKRDFVLTIGGDTEYPQHVQFQLSQDKTYILSDLQKFPIGAKVRVYYNLRGREHNGAQGIKYYNTIEAWKIESLKPAETPQVNSNNSEGSLI